ncbi:glucokinase [soil metagenome]
MAFAIGIDLGGTAIKGTAFRGSDPVARATTPTRAGEFLDDGATPAFAAGIKDLVAQLSGSDRPDAIGISAAGLASPDFSTIASLPNKLPGIERFPFREYLQLAGSATRFAVLNDAHAALLGEVWQGAALGRSHVVMLTLGTGVGGAILSGGHILAGRIGRAGHLGHTSLAPDGPPSICGCPGSLEDAIGNQTVAARSGGRFATTAALIEAVDAGDPTATAVWKKSVRALGAALVGLINTLDPETVVLGGGIANARSQIERYLLPYLDAHEWRPGGHRVPIAFATLGDQAGTYGAVYQALRIADAIPGPRSP